MKKLILFLLFAWQTLSVLAQETNVISDDQQLQDLRNFSVLADNGYRFSRVVKDKSLKFIKTDSLLGAKAYWLRLIVYNPSEEAGVFELTAYPNYDNTLYYRSGIAKNWVVHHSNIFGGIEPKLIGVHPYKIAALTHDTIYLKINVNTSNVKGTSFKAQITLTSAGMAGRQKQYIFTAWLVGTVILILFCLINLYIYLNFRDKTVLYYLIMQLGGMLYLPSYWYLFDSFLPGSIFSFLLGKHLMFYDLDSLIMHVAIVTILYGFVQLTRTYLNTSATLPVYDKLLLYGLYTYIIFSVIVACINVSGFAIESYTIGYDNILCLLLTLLIIYTSLVGYLHKLPTAGTFLLANFLSMLCVCSIAAYHIFVNINGSHNYWLPVLTAISQALAFSVALVSRTRAMRESLQAREMESRQLAFDLKDAAYRNKLQEKEILQTNSSVESEKYRNQLLQERVEAHQRELASSTLFMTQKNELLAYLKVQMKELKRSDRYNATKNLDGMITLLEKNKQLDTEWDKFKMHFEQVHPRFFEELKMQHPTLTQKEMRLYTYFQMNLSHKEIAALLDIDQASVRRAKTRLLKKMAAPNKGE